MAEKKLGRPAARFIFTAANITAKTPKIQHGKTVLVPLGTPVMLDAEAVSSVYFPEENLLRLEAQSYEGMLESGAIQNGTAKDAEKVKLKAEARHDAEVEIRQARVNARPENRT